LRRWGGKGGMRRRGRKGRYEEGWKMKENGKAKS
jgi:hypothetical protein